ncbi:MAG: hypothetical protein R6V85_11430 [Polyangia bacterium]
MDRALTGIVLVAALHRIGPEARPILERLAEHRHRMIRRAAGSTLEASALFSQGSR